MVAAEADLKPVMARQCGPRQLLETPLPLPLASGIAPAQDRPLPHRDEIDLPRRRTGRQIGWRGEAQQWTDGTALAHRGGLTGPGRDRMKAHVTEPDGLLHLARTPIVEVGEQELDDPRLVESTILAFCRIGPEGVEGQIDASPRAIHVDGREKGLATGLLELDEEAPRTLGLEPEDERVGLGETSPGQLPDTPLPVLAAIVVTPTHRAAPRVTRGGLPVDPARRVTAQQVGGRIEPQTQDQASRLRGGRTGHDGARLARDRHGTGQTVHAEPFRPGRLGSPPAVEEPDIAPEQIGLILWRLGHAFIEVVVVDGQEPDDEEIVSVLRTLQEIVDVLGLPAFVALHEEPVVRHPDVT